MGYSKSHTLDAYLHNDLIVVLVCDHIQLRPLRKRLHKRRSYSGLQRTSNLAAGLNVSPQLPSTPLSDVSFSPNVFQRAFAGLPRILLSVFLAYWG